MDEEKEKQGAVRSGWLTLELRVILIMAVISAVVGYISFLLNSSLLALSLAVVVLLVSAFALKSAMRIRESAKWWLNPAIVYIFLWIIVWTIFYNLSVR